MRNISVSLVALCVGQYAIHIVLHNRLDMRYEHKIVIGYPKGTRLRGRSGGRPENNTITELGCAAFHVHCVITPVRVYQVCVRLSQFKH